MSPLGLGTIIGLVLTIFGWAVIWLARPKRPTQSIDREDWAVRRCQSCQTRNYISSAFPLAEGYRFACWRCLGELGPDDPRGETIGAAVQVPTAPDLPISDRIDRESALIINGPPSCYDCSCVDPCKLKPAIEGDE